MPFVKALIWVAFIIILVIFAVNNWVPVTIALWGDLLLDTKLPVLIIGAFLIGWLPLYLWHRGSSWRMKRQIQTMQFSPPRTPLSMGSETRPAPTRAPPTQDTGGLEATT
ncbi:MAG: hypothetical protein V3V15_04545 [Sphingorhabdus sp.]